MNGDNMIRENGVREMNGVKVTGYMNEISRVASSVDACVRVDTCGNRMKVSLGAAHGSVAVLFCFYIGTVRVFVRHSMPVGAEELGEVSGELALLNLNFSGAEGYGYDERYGNMIFTADYRLRKTNPADDPGLDGFCTLVLRTVPSGLDKLAGMFSCLRSRPYKTY